MRRSIALIGIIGSVLAGTSLFPLAGIAQTNMDPTTERSNNRSMLLRVGNDAFQSGNFAEAEEAFRKLLVDYPEDAVIYYKLGNVMFRQKRMEAAITEYQKAIQINPNYAVAHNAIGTAYATQSRMAEATEAFQKAIQINPDYAEALANLGQVLWLQGKPTDSVGFLKKARDLYQRQQRFSEVNRIEKMLQEVEKQGPPVS